MERARAAAQQAATEPADSGLKASHELAITPSFIVRVRSAAVKSAISVAAEDVATANHAQRMNLAGQVLRSPGRWAEIMAEGVAANATILASAMGEQAIPDTDLEFAVASLWDAYAGSDGTL